jgi:hypothetical protein
LAQPKLLAGDYTLLWYEGTKDGAYRTATEAGTVACGCAEMFEHVHIAVSACLT